MSTRPTKLYKYLPDRMDRIGDIVVYNRVFFSSPINFNDPFDCARGVRFPDPDNLSYQDENDWREYFMHLARRREGEHDEATDRRDAEEEFRSGKHRDKTFVRDCEHSIEEAIRQFGQKLGVFCLSAIPGSVSMWAHYASNHRGVVIEFDHDKLVDNYGVVRSFPVSYVSVLPTLREYLRATRSQNELELAKLFLCRKSTEWQRECEWRFFTQSQNQHLDLPPETITSVVFGNRMAAEIRGLIVSWVRNSHISLRLTESVPSTVSFEMIPIDLKSTRGKVANDTMNLGKAQ